MNQKKKNLLAVGGIIGIVLGMLGAVPSFLTERYGLATGSSMLIVLGIILLAIAFGD